MWQMLNTLSLDLSYTLTSFQLLKVMKKVKSNRLKCDLEILKQIKIEREFLIRVGRGGKRFTPVMEITVVQGMIYKRINNRIPRSIRTAREDILEIKGREMEQEFEKGNAHNVFRNMENSLQNGRRQKHKLRTLMKRFSLKTVKSRRDGWSILNNYIIDR